MAAWDYVQNFDGLSTASLNGQDSWSLSSANDEASVQTGVVLDGTKSVKWNIGNNHDCDMRRTVTTCDSADFFFAFRVEDSGGNKSIQFRDNGGAGTVFFIGIPGSTAVSWSGDKVVLFDGSTANTVESTFATGTKFYVNVQFDDVNQNNKARARVWRAGSGWGTWTSWITVTSYTQINQIRMDFAGGDGTGANVSYTDSFAIIDPTQIPQHLGIIMAA